MDHDIGPLLVEEPLDVLRTDKVVIGRSAMQGSDILYFGGFDEVLSRETVAPMIVMGFSRSFECTSITLSQFSDYLHILFFLSFHNRGILNSSLSNGLRVAPSSEVDLCKVLRSDSWVMIDFVSTN